MRTLLLALSILILAACGDVGAPSVADLTPAQQLVALDTPGPLPKNDETIVKGYQATLDDLAAKYPGTSAHDMADLSVRGQGALEKHGVKASLYDIITALNEATPSGLQNVAYKDAVATYATLRAKGMDHDAAVKGLAAFLQQAKPGKTVGV